MARVPLKRHTGLRIKKQPELLRVLAVFLRGICRQRDLNPHVVANNRF